MRREFTSVGPLAAASTTNIRTASGVTLTGPITLNGALVTAGVATLDKPRRVLLTNSATETAVITLTGTGWAGQPFTENIALGVTGSSASVLDYKTITGASNDVALTGNLSIGTNGVAGSSWVYFDDWINAPGVAFQVSASGSVNYTVQQTMDDPNNSVSPVLPQNMTWLSSADTAAVGATASIQSNYQFAPVYARLVINSGATGSSSISGTFRQAGK